MDSSTPPPRATLTGLPAELRLLIFSFAMSNTTCHIRPSAPSKPPTKSIWSILHINRSIRHELLPLFFANVTFHLREDLTESNVKTWTEVVGEQAIGEMRNVVIQAKRICTGRWSRNHGSPTTTTTTTTTCTRTTTYHHETRTAQLLDLASNPNSGGGYRPTMFYQFAHALCSAGAPTCMRRTMAAITAEGCEEWYLRVGEGLTGERLVGWWRGVSGDYYGEEGRERGDV